MMWTAVKEPGRCRDAPNNLIVFQGLAQLRRWAIEPKTYHKDGASTAEHSECHQQKLKNSSAQNGRVFVQIASDIVQYFNIEENGSALKTNQRNGLLEFAEHK